MDEMMDVFGVMKEENGKHIITKNGEFFLNCSGGEAEALKIADLLNNDSKKVHSDRRQKNGRNSTL